MRLLLASLLLGFAVSAHAGRVEQGQLEAGSRLKINQDKGVLVVVATNTKSVSYRVEFSQTLLRGDIEKSKINTGEGLTVEAGIGVHAKTTLYVPADLEIDVQFGDGTVNLGKISGKINASVANGTLIFDGSALPKNAGVRARATNGTVKTPWGNSGGTGVEVSSSQKTAVYLLVGNGSVVVK